MTSWGSENDGRSFGGRGEFTVLCTALTPLVAHKETNVSETRRTARNRRIDVLLSEYINFSIVPLLVHEGTPYFL